MRGGLGSHLNQLIEISGRVDVGGTHAANQTPDFCVICLRANKTIGSHVFSANPLILPS